MRNASWGLWLVAGMLCMGSLRAEEATETLILLNCVDRDERHQMVHEIRERIDQVMEFNPDIPRVIVRPISSSSPNPARPGELATLTMGNGTKYAIHQSQHRGYKFVIIKTDYGAPGILGNVKSYLDDVFDSMPGETMKEKVERAGARARREALKMMMRD